MILFTMCLMINSCRRSLSLSLSLSLSHFSLSVSPSPTLSSCNRTYDTNDFIMILSHPNVYTKYIWVKALHVKSGEDP